MSDRTGITREAGTLSGCDVGREVWNSHSEAWEPLQRINHSCYNSVDVKTRTGMWIYLTPADTVQIRGRDE